MTTHRIKGACEHCWFYHRLETMSADEGQCRQGPPTAIVSVDKEIKSAWPVVWNRDWCGQWREADTP